MTRPRQEFLSALFHILEQKAIRYCILRNYQNLYEDASSDVDMLVTPEDVRRTEDCLAEAAAASNHLFVQRGRFAVHSCLFWHPEGGLLRVDIQREVRWKIFPILTAEPILGLRRRFGDFYVPGPSHESAVLFCAAIARGNLSERYQQRLAELFQQAPDHEEHGRLLQAAFGTLGNRLAALQARILEKTPPPDLWKAARWSLARKAILNSAACREALRLMALDIGRFQERVRRPVGISMLHASNSPKPRDLQNLFMQFEFLFPSKKGSVQLFRQAPGCKPPPLGPRPRFRRLYALFKGGLIVTHYDLSSDRDLPRVIRSCLFRWQPTRSFFCADSSSLETWLGHVETGFMADLSLPSDGPVPNEPVVRFITAVLASYRAPRKNGGKRGCFVVLVGLDGSGKTTVARKLCCLGTEQERFRRIRYFHWRPAILPTVLFPLPEFGNVPRKPKLESTLWRSLLSAARLLNSGLRARVAYWVRIRPLLRRNAIVLLDRYYYNYYLDPDSVKYSGPAWLVDWLRPLFPRPDLVVKLKAPPEVLLARKQELSGAEIRRQSAVLDDLKIEAAHTLEVAAVRPAADIARTILTKILEIAS
jgi:thymidylate kinase